QHLEALRYILSRLLSITKAIKLTNRQILVYDIISWCQPRQAEINGNIRRCNRASKFEPQRCQKGCNCMPRFWRIGTVVPILIRGIECHSEVMRRVIANV